MSRLPCEHGTDWIPDVRQHSRGNPLPRLPCPLISIRSPAGSDAIAAREAAGLPVPADLAGNNGFADVVAAGTRAQEETNARHVARQRALGVLRSCEGEGEANGDDYTNDDDDREDGNTHD